MTIRNWREMPSGKRVGDRPGDAKRKKIWAAKQQIPKPVKKAASKRDASG